VEPLRPIRTTNEFGEPKIEISNNEYLMIRNRVLSGNTLNRSPFEVASMYNQLTDIFSQIDYMKKQREKGLPPKTSPGGKLPEDDPLSINPEANRLNGDPQLQAHLDRQGMPGAPGPKSMPTNINIPEPMPDEIDGEGGVLGPSQEDIYLDGQGNNQQPDPGPSIPPVIIPQKEPVDETVPLDTPIIDEAPDDIVDPVRTDDSEQDEAERVLAVPNSNILTEGPVKRDRYVLGGTLISTHSYTIVATGSGKNASSARTAALTVAQNRIRLHINGGDLREYSWNGSPSSRALENGKTPFEEQTITLEVLARLRKK